jgi:membrane protein implicated in regulation of membrane protease activity
MYDFNLVWAWLGIGVILIILDIIAIGGVGFIFLGLGAISTSVCLSYFDLELHQVPFFGIASLIWFILLYKPIKRYLSKEGKDSRVGDIIGSLVEVTESTIYPNSLGKVKWSGAIFNASLEAEENYSVPVGTFLIVERIEGNILICKLKS